MKKNRVILPDTMDKECIALCGVLNELPHTKTEDSCCGHLKTPFSIWFRCSSFTYLAIIARAIDRRYAGTKKEWQLISETADRYPRFLFRLTSVDPYESYAEMDADTERIGHNIHYWRENFLEYFRSNGEVTNPGKSLTLTCEDIVQIIGIHEQVITEAVGTTRDFAEETLRRFSEQRKK